MMTEGLSAVPPNGGPLSSDDWTSRAAHQAPKKGPLGMAALGAGIEPVAISKSGASCRPPRRAIAQDLIWLVDGNR